MLAHIGIHRKCFMKEPDRRNLSRKATASSHCSAPSHHPIDTNRKHEHPARPDKAMNSITEPNAKSPYVPLPSAAKDLRGLKSMQRRVAQGGGSILVKIAIDSLLFRQAVVGEQSTAQNLPGGAASLWRR